MMQIATDFIDVTELVSIRRDLHAHPELGFEEERTSDLIAATLSNWGVPVHRGIGKTGVVGVVKGRSNGRSIGLRADMDALPIAERNAFSHASVHVGKMHACGHDGHIAMLLAAGKYLARHRDFDGTVYLIFQPAEEGAGGAREMIKDGLFERFPMEAIFGAHNWPGLPVGQFAVKSGPISASSSTFRILIRGKGSHAAMPHDGIDPIPAACQIVQAFQTVVSRNKKPMDTGVISVTMIRAGETFNVGPELCELCGTVRTFTTDVLDLIERRMRTIAESTCRAFNVTCEFGFNRIYPPTVNHPKETEFVREVLAGIVGSQNVLEFEPTTGAEDFSFYLLQKGGCYFMIGNGMGPSSDGASMANTLHNPGYDFNDELIPLGGKVWARLAERWLSTTI